MTVNTNTLSDTSGSEFKAIRLMVSPPWYLLVSSVTYGRIDVQAARGLGSRRQQATALRHRVANGRYAMPGAVSSQERSGNATVACLAISACGFFVRQGIGPGFWTGIDCERLESAPAGGVAALNHRPIVATPTGCA